MTVIIIAHRLSTLDICDRIMVIQDGRLVGFESPAELSDQQRVLPRVDEAVRAPVVTPDPGGRSGWLPLPPGLPRNRWATHLVLTNLMHCPWFLKP